MADPTDWGAYAEENAPAYGVDPKLARAVMQVESSGNPSARSKAGAVGLMQLMPKTAKRFGVDPTDPYQNIHGGLSLLSELTKQHQGDPNKILAAYNGGTRGLTDPLPETQAYVPKVKSLMGEDDVTDQIMGGGAKKKASSLPQVPEPPVNPITGTAEAPSLTGFGKNVLTSGGRFLGDTAQGMWDLTKGVAKTGYELYQAPDKGDYLTQLGLHAVEAAPGVAQNIGRYAKERYGGVTPALHTLYTDPVGAAADVSTLAGGGEMVAGKALGMGRTARALGAVSSATDPFSVARIPARTGKAEKLMSEALKPTEQVLKRDPKIVQKGLKYDVSVSKAGLAENRTRIKSLLDDLDESWSALSQEGKTASPFDVALSPEVQKLSESYRSINPDPDWATIDKTVQGFLNHYGPQGAISADQAREVISNTYKRRASTYEGREAGVTAETEQALAKATLNIFQKHEEDLTRGSRYTGPANSTALAIPGAGAAETGAPRLESAKMKTAGTELSDRIRLEGVIQRAVNQELKYHQFIPAAAGMSGGILAAMLGHPGFAATAVTLGMARTIMRRPDVQSALAQFWKKGHSIGSGRVAGVGLTAVGTTERATRDKKSPIPEPPTAGLGNPSDPSLTIRSDGTDDVTDQLR